MWTLKKNQNNGLESISKLPWEVYIFFGHYGTIFDFSNIKKVANIIGHYSILQKGLHPSEERPYSTDKGLQKHHGSVFVEREEEQHLLSGQFKVYSDLTHKYDNLADENQLVQFFAEVFARREHLEVETCVSEVDTTVGANSGPGDHGLSPIELKQL